jgi:hypothetical protein
MSKIISISIPEKLHERLQNLKDKINVSKLCQDAILKEIKKIEDFRKRIHKSPKTDKIIERLSKEMNESEGLVYERGRKDGEQWAKTAHYDDLYGAVCKQEDEDIINSGPVDDLEPEILDYLSEKHKIRFGGIDDYLDKVLPVKVHSHNWYIYTISYRRGWYEAILDFWNEIKDKI